MEEYVQALEVEIQERSKLIPLLEQGDLFYESQRGEFKVVCLVSPWMPLKPLSNLTEKSICFISFLLRLTNNSVVV